METKPARLVFFRPEKVASKNAKIIIGTTNPDEVIVLLKNGHKAEVRYNRFGYRELIAGVYELNNEPLKINISPGKTYYIKCAIKSEGYRIMAQLEELDQPEALRELKFLIDQGEITSTHRLMIF